MLFIVCYSSRQIQGKSFLLFDIEKILLHKPMVALRNEMWKNVPKPDGMSKNTTFLYFLGVILTVAEMTIEVHGVAISRERFQTTCELEFRKYFGSNDDISVASFKSFVETLAKNDLNLTQLVSFSELSNDNKVSFVSYFCQQNSSSFQDCRDDFIGEADHTRTDPSLSNLYMANVGVSTLCNSLFESFVLTGWLYECDDYQEIMNNPTVKNATLPQCSHMLFRSTNSFRTVNVQSTHEFWVSALGVSTLCLKKFFFQHYFEKHDSF